MADGSLPEEAQPHRLCSGGGVGVPRLGQETTWAHCGYSADYKDYFKYVSEAGAEDSLLGSVY